MKKINLIIVLSCTITVLYAGLPEGWINHYILRTTGTGVAREGFTSQYSIQESACRAAVITAQYRALKIICGRSVLKSEGVTSSSVAGRIKKGKIVNHFFNAATNTCTVVYEINKNNVLCREGR